jgi:hypothetical protein
MKKTKLRAIRLGILQDICPLSKINDKRKNQYILVSQRSAVG